MSEEIIQEYDAKLDKKHRCIIKGIPAIDRYHIKVFKNGNIEMTPRVLASPQELSENTLRMIYSSIKNLKEGKVGSSVDFEKHQKYLEPEKDK